MADRRQRPLFERVWPDLLDAWATSRGYQEQVLGRIDAVLHAADVAMERIVDGRQVSAFFTDWLVPSDSILRTGERGTFPGDPQDLGRGRYLESNRIRLGPGRPRGVGVSVAARVYAIDALRYDDTAGFTLRRAIEVWNERFPESAYRGTDPEAAYRLDRSKVRPPELAAKRRGRRKGSTRKSLDPLPPIIFHE